MRVVSVLPWTGLFVSMLTFGGSHAYAQGAPPPPKATSTPAAPAPKATAAPVGTAPKAAPAPKAAAPAPKATAAPVGTAPKAAPPAPKAAAPQAPKAGAAPTPASTAPAAPKAEPQTPKERGDALLVAGRKLREAHEPEKALPLLEEAYGLLQDPEAGLELMRVYEELGKLVEAITLGEKLDAMPAGPKETLAVIEARKKVKEASTALAARISTLKLEIKRPSKDLIRVKIDERTLLPEQLDKPVRVNPGKREILVTASGYQPLNTSQDIEAGTVREYPLTIDLTPVPAPTDVMPHTIIPEEPPSPPLPPLVKVGIGVSSGLGVVAIATGIAAGVSYVGFVDAYHRRECGNNCETEVQERGGTLQALSVTSLVTGIAAIGTGAATFIYARKVQHGPDQVGIRVVPTAGGIVVLGRF